MCECLTGKISVPTISDKPWKAVIQNLNILGIVSLIIIQVLNVYL